MSKCSRRGPVIPRQPNIDFDYIKQTRHTLALRDYQNAHLSEMLKPQNTRFGELSDAGTGKTPTCCLFIYAQWYLHGDKTIWVMPLALIRKNREELLLWSEFNADEVVIVSGTPKQRAAQLSAPNAKVFLCSFDCFKMHWRDMLQLQPKINLLAIDEWHLGFSNHAYQHFGQRKGPQRTIELYECMRYIKKLLPMTGTMINGKLTSAYPFLYMACPLAYQTYKNFLHWHAVLDEFGNPKLWLNHDRLGLILRDHSVRVSFKQAFGSEPLQIQVEMCEMSVKQRKAYSQMHEEALLELEDSWLEAGSEAIKVMRCRQIMQHPNTLDLPEGEDGKLSHAILHMQAALDAGERLVVFETTVAGQELLVSAATKLGARVGLINGNTLDKGLVDEQFRHELLDIVICAPICAGVGFNWGFLNHMLFYSVDYQDTTFIQNYRRAMRGERKTTLLVTLLQYTNSIDQRINSILNQKSKDRMLVNDNNDTAVLIYSKSQPQKAEDFDISKML